MKKYLSILVFLFSFLASATAFAEITTVESRNIAYNVKLSPILVKTICGKSTNGIHRFSTLSELHAFLKEKEDKGLGIRDSHQGKLNLIICDEDDAGHISNLADMTNMVTSTKFEGPVYELVQAPVVIPERVKQKLEKTGIRKPVVLLCVSGKKHIKGGYWRKILEQALFCFF